jgi:DNA recombination protein RmuC
MGMQFAFDAVSLLIGLLAGMAVMWALLRASAARDAAEHAELATRLDLGERIEEELRDGIAQRDRQIAKLQVELAAVRERQAELTTTIAKERMASREKLDLLEKAQAQLSDAFKALSAEALRHNNQSFLDLAKETLSAFQEQARGDLERRQEAIGAVSFPCAPRWSGWTRRSRPWSRPAPAPMRG